jgi:hypothetical protein
MKTYMLLVDSFHFCCFSLPRTTALSVGFRSKMTVGAAKSFSQLLVTGRVSVVGETNRFFAPHATCGSTFDLYPVDFPSIVWFERPWNNSTLNTL